MNDSAIPFLFIVVQLLGAAICSRLSSALWVQMRGIVNTTQPPGLQYDFYTRAWINIPELIRRYRQVDPNGRLHIYLGICTGLIVVLLVGTAFELLHLRQ